MAASFGFGFVTGIVLIPFWIFFGLILLWEIDSLGRSMRDDRGGGFWAGFWLIATLMFTTHMTGLVNVGAALTVNIGATLVWVIKYIGVGILYALFVRGIYNSVTWGRKQAEILKGKREDLRTKNQGLSEQDFATLWATEKSRYLDTQTNQGVSEFLNVRLAPVVLFWVPDLVYLALVQFLGDLLEVLGKLIKGTALRVHRGIVNLFVGRI
jgi:hypothetical protein